MNEARFWSMLEAAWPKTEQAIAVRQAIFSGKLDEADQEFIPFAEIIASLTSQLNELSAEELLTFDRILEQKLYDIDRSDIQIYTDGSEDGFLYCRGFIVGNGRDYYEMIKANPSLALIDMEFEALCYLPYHLYEEKFGPVPVSNLSRETGTNAAGWDVKAG